MHKVLAHIDARLDQPLDLAALADVAHFSPYHFHRLFAAWMDETLGDYVRRRRVEVAALRLMTQPRLSVLQAALSVGFGSGEAFSRAFRAHFGSSPSAWRAKRKLDHVGLPDFAKNEPSLRNARRPEQPMNVQIISRPPTLIAYLRYTGPFGAPVGNFWGTRVAPWIQSHALWPVARYGISHDDPSITPPDQCRYDACVEVDAGFTPSDGFQKTTLPGGRYAALPFTGKPEDIGEAWNALLRDWLPSSGFQFDNRPAFEHYPLGAAYDETTGVFECEICIPIAPL
jgi:AraC family transcriptional regulator